MLPGIVCTDNFAVQWTCLLISLPAVNESCRESANIAAGAKQSCGSKECQKKHWKRHKNICKDQALSASPGDGGAGSKGNTVG